MSQEDDRHSSLVCSSKDYFGQMVDQAIERRKVKMLPMAKSYLVELLQSYIHADNLFDEMDSSGRRVRATLAETMLKAQSSDALVRIELLKKLGDRSLYISGFFGDSLQRKLVDVDYYADMGCTAYGALAGCVREDTLAQMYREFARKFQSFVDLLSDISSQAKTSDEENIMRLYEVYARTGSAAARDRLIEKGLIAVPVENLPIKKRQ